MRLFKKIILTILTILTITILAAYLYFNQKFSPEENYLTVKNESTKVPIKWIDENKSVLLLPVKFKNDSATYYLQFDTGSPTTVLYKNAIQEVKSIQKSDERAKAMFHVGQTEITSDKFKIIDQGKKSNDEDLEIIGTLGSDILEDRKTLINLKENYVELNINTTPASFQNQLFHFSFKKRKIIIPALMNAKQEKFVYDSGTSAYELLTSKENWIKLKTPNSKIVVEKGNSWGNILTTYTAKTSNILNFKTTEVPLHEVTYVEGYSKTQYLLMKYSGMSGMLGNRIFLKNEIFIDAKTSQMAIQ